MNKILSIVWYKVLPAQYGGQKGITLFNKYLGKEISLTCLCSKENQTEEQLTYKLISKLPKSKTQFLNPKIWVSIIRYAKKEKATHIIIEHPYHGIAGWFAKKFTGAKLIIHTHNIEYLRFKKLGKWWWRLLYIYEKWSHRRADLSLFKTEVDKQTTITNFNLQDSRCALQLYGIDTDEKFPEKQSAKNIITKKHNLKSDERLILFAGTLDYMPNAKAVELIYKEIAPKLLNDNQNVKIIICGRNKEQKFQYLKNLSHPMIIQAGEVKDIYNYFAAADVFINPVLSTAGIQTKNIDALGVGCPVVCFTETAVPAEYKISDKFLIATENYNWDQFYQNILSALKLSSIEISKQEMSHLYWNQTIKGILEYINKH